MKSYFFEYLSKPISIFIFVFALIISKADFSRSEELYFKEMEIDNSTKLDDSSSELPTNPFEIVEMLRRANSLNDATKPSDAIDEALKSFNGIDQKEKISIK